MPPRNHYGKPGNTVPSAERAQIIEWIEQGVSRNEIAKRAGRSGSTISGIAKAEGLEFGGRTKVAAATEARRIDNRARRSEISAALLEDAMRLRGQMWEPCTLHSFGGKDNVHNSIDLAEPIFADKLKAMQAAASALGRHIDLERHDAEEKAASARSLLSQLGEALGVSKPDA